MTDTQLKTLVDQVLGDEPISYKIKTVDKMDLYLDKFYVGVLFKDYMDDHVFYGFIMDHKFIDKLMVFNMLPKRDQPMFIDYVYQKILSIISPKLPEGWDQGSKNLKYLMKTKSGIMFY